MELSCANGVHTIEWEWAGGLLPPDGFYRCLECRWTLERRGGFIVAKYPPGKKPPPAKAIAKAD